MQPEPSLADEARGPIAWEDPEPSQALRQATLGRPAAPRVLLAPRPSQSLSLTVPRPNYRDLYPTAAAFALHVATFEKENLKRFLHGLINMNSVSCVSFAVPCRRASPVWAIMAEISVACTAGRNVAK